MLILGTDRKPRRYSGKLIAFEGGDATGKTTALTKCFERAKAEGYDAIWSDWSESRLMKKALKKGKKKHLMTPLTFTLMQSANIGDRLESQILPHLKKGGIVFADRWIYTLMARDVVRGMDRAYVRDVIAFAPEADLAVYFKLPVEEARERKKNFDDEKISFYEAGADLFPDLDREAGFLKFQKLVHAEYEKHVVSEYGMTVLDASPDMDTVEAGAWALVQDCLDGKRARKAA